MKRLLKEIIKEILEDIDWTPIIRRILIELFDKSQISPNSRGRQMMKEEVERLASVARPE